LFPFLTSNRHMHVAQRATRFSGFSPMQNTDSLQLLNSAKWALLGSL